MSRQEHQILNLEALLEVSKAMGSEVHLENLLELILNKATEVMDAERSSLFLYDSSKKELWSKIAQGIESKEIRFSLGTGIAGDVAKTRKIENIPDAYQDSRFNPEFDKKSEFKTKTMLCLPMIGAKSELVGVIQVLNKKNGELFDKDDEDLLEALGSHAAIALQRAQLIESYVENQKLEETLRLAHNIQMSLLPKHFPPFPNKTDIIDIYASIEPAKEVGGDLYDFILLDENHLCFAIGDVSGKGIPAALFMAVTKTLLKATAHISLHPSKIIEKMNNFLSVDNEADMFCTFFCGILNLQTGRMSYSNAGHNPPYILRKDNSLESLTQPIGTALGVLEDLEFKSAETKIEKGESVFLYTDGVNEAMNEKFEEYGYPRMNAVLERNYSLHAKELIEKIVEDVKLFVGKAPQSDDITLLTIRLK